MGFHYVDSINLTSKVSLHKTIADGHKLKLKMTNNIYLFNKLIQMVG